MTTHEDVLATVDAARARTRRAKRAGWIPLLVFGILVLPALAFHAHSLGTHPDSGLFFVAVDDMRGGPLFWYWQFAIPAGYVVVALLYTARNRRAGVRSPVVAYTVTGAVLVVALYYLATAGAPRFGWSDFGIYGLDATVTIGLSLYVLAWLERSIALAVAATVVTAATLVASTYTVANLVYRIVDIRATPWWGVATNDVLVSATLLLGAAVVWFTDRRHTRNARPA